MLETVKMAHPFKADTDVVIETSNISQPS